MASKISLAKSFTNTEQVPCLVHMNVLVNILYLHIYKQYAVLMTVLLKYF